jgi:hypothetical protein
MQEQAAANRPQFYSKDDKKKENGGTAGDVSGQKRTSEKEVKKPEIARKPFQMLSVSGITCVFIVSGPAEVQYSDREAYKLKIA